MRPGYDKASCSHSKGRGRAEEEPKHVHRRKPNKRNSCPTSVSEFRDTCARGQSAGAFQAWSPKFLSGKQKLVAQMNLSASKLETLQNLWHYGKRQKVCLCCWQVANPLSLLNQAHIQTSTLKSSRMSSYSALFVRGASASTQQRGFRPINPLCAAAPFFFRERAADVTCATVVSIEKITVRNSLNKCSFHVKILLDGVDDVCSLPIFLLYLNHSMKLSPTWRVCVCVEALGQRCLYMGLSAA